jgi:hypothetical protein
MINVGIRMIVLRIADSISAAIDIRAPVARQELQDRGR